jgi:hypothetical protein
MEQRWNDLDRGKPKDSEKNVSQCQYVHTTNATWTDLDANPGLRVEKPVIDRLCYGVAEM